MHVSSIKKMQRGIGFSHIKIQLNARMQSPIDFTIPTVNLREQQSRNALSKYYIDRYLNGNSVYWQTRRVTAEPYFELMNRVFSKGYRKF